MAALISLPIPQWWFELGADEAVIIKLAREIVGSDGGEYVAMLGIGESASMEFEFGDEVVAKVGLDHWKESMRPWA